MVVLYQMGPSIGLKPGRVLLLQFFFTIICRVSLRGPIQWAQGGHSFVTGRHKSIRYSSPLRKHAFIQYEAYHIEEP